MVMNVNSGIAVELTSNRIGASSVRLMNNQQSAISFYSVAPHTRLIVSTPLPVEPSETHAMIARLGLVTRSG
jgi:hypothetical protein